MPAPGKGIICYAEISFYSAKQKRKVHLGGKCAKALKESNRVFAETIIAMGNSFAPMAESMRKPIEQISNMNRNLCTYALGVFPW